jgi:hypothetical protein
MPASKNGIEILGTTYSPRLRSLFDEMQRSSGRKIVEFTEISGRVDSRITVRPDKIIVGVHRGSSEDNVAHEFMHAILSAEGFPQTFAIATSPLSEEINGLITSDFDHLIINVRLLRVGYDARHGFLAKADPYQPVLEISEPATPDQRAVFVIAMLHELLKFHYYVGIPGAQEAILAKFYSLRTYWKMLSDAINRLPKEPTPSDMWQVVTNYVRIADQVCIDVGAAFRLSDLVGFEPVPMREGALDQPARRYSDQRIEPGGGDMRLVRVVLTNGGILVAAGLVPSDSVSGMAVDMDLHVSEFAR